MSTNSVGKVPAIDGTGRRNTGRRNTGRRNTGRRNTGRRNTGRRNGRRWRGTTVDDGGRQTMTGGWRTMTEDDGRWRGLNVGFPPPSKTELCPTSNWTLSYFKPNVVLLPDSPSEVILGCIQNRQICHDSDLLRLFGQNSITIWYWSTWGQWASFRWAIYVDDLFCSNDIII